MLLQFKTIDLYQSFLHSKNLLKKLFSPILAFFSHYLSKGVFGKNLSTISALLSVTEEIRENLDSGLKVFSVFLDLAKAFDTVKHDILIQKLESYGLRGPAAKLIKSYLSERNQFFQNGQNFSGTIKTHVGVPQGSVLRPLMFLVYINDPLSQLSNGKSSLILFADDTSLICSDKCSPIEKANN